MDQNPTPSGGKQKNTAMAIIAYILFFIPLLTGDAKKDDFVNYHTKQGLVLFIVSAIVYVLQMILIYNFWRLAIIFQLLSLAILVLAIIGIVNAASGKKQPLPLIGQFADKFKF